MILRVSRSSGQVFCRMPHYLNLSTVLIVMILGLWVIRKKAREMKGYFHPILSSVHTVTWFVTTNVGLECLAELVFFRFFHCKVLLFTLPMLCILKQIHYVKPISKGWGFMLQFCDDIDLHKIFGILLCGRCVNSPPSPIYAIPYLCQYRIMYIYFGIPWWLSG